MQNPSTSVEHGSPSDAAPSDLRFTDVVGAIRANAWRIATAGLAAGVLAYGLSWLIPPTFTARTSFISPQQQQNSAAAALASLGALSGLAGAATGIKSPADQYIGLLLSTSVSDRIIARFNLKEVYDVKLMMDARKKLGKNVRVTAGKKDNLISVEVDDEQAQRAADIANAYVEELKTLSNRLALTEAQQRRAFFETQMRSSKEALTSAQLKLQQSGFNAGALKSEPKAAAEGYAQLKAEVTSTEVRLGALRRSLTDAAPEVQRLAATLTGLRNELARIEAPISMSGEQDYVSAYREYKYQETLFEVYAKQFELARMDEAREGTLIQVLDAAEPPERRSKPRKSLIAAGALIAGLLASAAFFVVRRREMA